MKPVPPRIISDSARPGGKPVSAQSREVGQPARSTDLELIAILPARPSTASELLAQLYAGKLPNRKKAARLQS